MTTPGWVTRHLYKLNTAIQCSIINIYHMFVSLFTNICLTNIFQLTECIVQKNEPKPLRTTLVKSLTGSLRIFKDPQRPAKDPQG